MAEPNEKGHHPGPSRSEPSKGKRYEDLTEVERKAAAGKKITECSSLKQIDKLLFNSVLRSEISLVILIYMVSPVLVPLVCLVVFIRFKASLSSTNVEKTNVKS